MCRVLGCVSERAHLGPARARCEAENPLIRQSEEHDSGWGMAVYKRADGADAHCVRFPEAAYVDGDFISATKLRGRIFNVHVRRATMGGLSAENTHPFCMGNYSFCHNGTVLNFSALEEPGVARRAGRHGLGAALQLPASATSTPRGVVGALRHLVRTAIERSPFSGLNFLFSDGERLYAYRLGIFELHWLAQPGRLLVASERLTRRALAQRAAGRAAGARPGGRRRSPTRCAWWATHGSSAADIQKFEEGAAPARRRARRVRRRARGTAAGGTSRVSRRLALLANPAARGGHALDGLPSGGGRAQTAGRRVPRGEDPLARPRLQRGARRGRRRRGSGVARAATASPAAWRACCAARTCRSRSCRRARQRLRAGARDPQGAARGRRASRSTARSAWWTWPLANGRPFLGIASLGFDSDANRIANDAKLVKRQPRLPLRGAARAGRLEARHLRASRVDGETRTFRGCSVAVANSKAYGGGMFLVPHAEIDDGELDVFTFAATSKAEGLRALPKVFKGAHVDNPNVSLRHGQKSYGWRPTAPSRSTPTATRSPSCPCEVRVEPRSLRCRRRPDAATKLLLARAVRGPSPPPRPRRAAPPRPAACCCGSSRARSSSWASASTGAAVLVSATNGKTTTASMIASVMERAGRPARAQPRRART